MEIIKNYDKTSNVLTYVIRGRLDTQSSSDFQECLDEGFDEGKFNLIFDCSELEYVSSAGLRTVLYAKKRVDEREENSDKPKGFLKLINVNDEILEIFDMTGFTDMLDINTAESSNDA